MASRIPRDPSESVRDRRFKDKVRSVINSLIQRGEIILVAGNTYIKPCLLARPSRMPAGSGLLFFRTDPR